MLATRSAVAPGLSAALIGTSQGRAVLVAVRANGAVAGAVNVPYGSQFPAPAGGALPCEAGQCVVIAKQSDANAIASAFALSASGSWTDVSGPEGFASQTPLARTLVLPTGLAIAVQDRAGGVTVWTVRGWDRARYSVIGCAAATGTLAPQALSMATCLA